MRARDTALSILVILVLVLPSGMFLMQKALHIDLPSWLSAEDATNLSGSTSEVNLGATATLTGFKEGEFQSALETEIENFIPCKASVLIGQATLQRDAIAASNALFGWEWYPTFYGSEILTSCENDLLVSAIVKKSETVATGLESTARLYNEVASSHPDIDFYIGMPSSGSSSTFTNDLVSNSVDVNYIDEHCFDLLDDRIKYVDLIIDNIDQYKELYFKTDHHWKMNGGYRAYALIAEKMGLSDDILPMGEPIGFDVEFFGSKARVGLDTATGPDDLIDYHFELPQFSVFNSFDHIDQEDPLDFIASTEAYSNGKATSKPFANHYANYFHTDLDFIELRANTEKSQGRSLLIAGDSFTNNMERLFLNNFDRVYSYNYKKFNKETLGEVINQIGDIETVLIIQSFENLS